LKIELPQILKEHLEREEGHESHDHQSRKVSISFFISGPFFVPVRDRPGTKTENRNPKKNPERNPEESNLQIVVNVSSSGFFSTTTPINGTKLTDPTVVKTSGQKLKTEKNSCDTFSDIDCTFGSNSFLYSHLFINVN
jgi:hypothetical protein